MVKPKKKNNTKLAVYFGGLVIFIALVSIVFKGVDLFRSSEFDGKNRFTIALVDKDRIDVLSVSPSESALSRLTVLDTTDLSRLEDYEVPYDAVAIARKEIEGSPKKQMASLLLRKRSLQTKLTIVDVFNLWLVSRSVPSENIQEARASIKNEEHVDDFASSYFKDPQIEDEDLTIQVTNTTDRSGLGNRVADYATNLGGNVVLVNTSREKEKKSKIYYTEPNYTVVKISKILGIPIEKKETNAISDIIILLGEDY